jgi:nitrite reductase/ring-hydroxylating ferredoxin subunit
MTWIETITEEQLSPGDKQVFKTGDKKLLLINNEGKIYAVDNACPHLKLPLKTGKIGSDCTITCPFHRSTFDLETGEVKEWSTFPPLIGNLMGKLSAEKSLPVYPTRVESGKIMVDL